MAEPVPEQVYRDAAVAYDDHASYHNYMVELDAFRAAVESAYRAGAGPIKDRVRAIHSEVDGRCVACGEWCDCLDRVVELGDDVEVARAARLCEHGNAPWPCSTIVALDAP